MAYENFLYFASRSFCGIPGEVRDLFRVPVAVRQQRLQ